MLWICFVLLANADDLTADVLSGLKFRALGPALTSGRISDFAVDPRDHNHYYVAVASGGVWETKNGGAQFNPIFDGQTSYSIGCLALDPSNPNTLWVGTGENNSQRSVGYGDGLYRSRDGGQSWEHMGLKDSEHIGRIAIDPTNSDRVWVAAQGPLWASGGDRGLYRTVDGGKTWKKVLDISANTGVNEVWLDPMDPNTLYASSYQRRRHVFTLINGGPESAIYKSTDGGDNFRKINKGLPEVDLGRIGLTIPPNQSDVLYAIVEAAKDKGGFFKSTDRGEHWEKMSDYVAGSPQYYNELIADPMDINRVYAMDTYMQVTTDGGKTFSAVGEKFKHVDNHALWIEPENPNHLLAGCDGGIYESFDRGTTWLFKANLPVTQFYRLAVDNTEPFYNVYGGTQDNFTLGGPAQTMNQHGILNQDWFVVVGGDGFQPQVDPTNPDLVYGESQYGGLVRHDRRTGENVDIQPQPPAEGPALRWNWDSPLAISHHHPERLYFAANILFRSEDRGQTWHALGGDLTRQVDRNRLPVMDQIWPIDAVAKNASTSFFGNIVSFSESWKDEQLLAAGTDDGLIQISENGGATWTRLDKFPAIPDMTYVQALAFSKHERNTLYAAFNNHKRGDFKPYLLVSRDLGKTWKSLTTGLDARGSIYALALDSEQANLMFCGTEFGLSVSLDGGQKWLPWKAGLPPVAIRDIALQENHGDLVLASFGRGFFVLDDYRVLRNLSTENSALLQAGPALQYVPRLPLGLRDKAFQGESFFAAPNPPYGAPITYFIKESYKTTKQSREEAEKKARTDKKDPGYPSWEQLRQESLEEEAQVILEIRDEAGAPIRRLIGPASKGLNRIYWDLRYPSPFPISLKPWKDENPFSEPPLGPQVLPGTYQVQMFLRNQDQWQEMGSPVRFEVKAAVTNSIAPEDPKELLAFQKETALLFQTVTTAGERMDQMAERLKFIKKAAQDMPQIQRETYDQIRQLEKDLEPLQRTMQGNRLVARRQEPTLPGLQSRLYTVIYGHWNATAAVTQTHRDQVRLAREGLAQWLPQYQAWEKRVLALESTLDQLAVPYTPGRKIQ
ncbi:MAG: glycosyl hydrolase [Acidobacteria bacterium]|nr:glycosyl hydrolase [Acidobacteriota bacterium]MCB9398314.1 glycosyl hydrolase [Acidobacteriota bacterium]